MTKPAALERLKSASARWLSSPKAPVVASVAGLVVLATLLRVWRLGAVGFGGDEAVYAGQAALFAHVPGMDRWFIPASRGNSNFLATQWLMSVVYRVFGVSDVGARLVSVTASVLTVVTVYLIARRLYPRQRDAVAAGLLLAVSGYSILLGRLALLDATACFLVTLTMYFLVRWLGSGKLLWAALTVASGAFAVQAKVTSALVLLVVVLVVVLTGSWRRLGVVDALALVVTGLVASAPALVQVITNSGGMRGYLAASTARTSAVSWSYYPGVLWAAEGPLLFLVLLFGVVLALVRRQRANLVPLVWLGVYAVFVQVYPLKGFNYLLPLVPPLTLLAGHAIGWVTDGPARRLSLRRGVVVPAVGVVLVVSQLGAVDGAIANDRAAGMREAALWLRAHGAARAGAMALSHGSGQYVLSFYGRIDSYPYGRFRIATVLPGGHVVDSTPRPDGAVPLDWVRYWPPRLIDQGRVEYLVYQTRPLDDPPEQSEVAGSVTEKQFRSLIGHYGGRLVHTVYWRHEARVYIYRITRRLARPVVTAESLGAVSAAGRPLSGISAPGAVRQAFLLRARGFAYGSPLSISYRDRVVGRAVASRTGSAMVRVRVPASPEPRYHLIVTDRTGSSASVTGVPRTRVAYSVEAGVVHVTGAGFEPGGDVTISFRDKPVEVTHAHADGSVSVVFPLPPGTSPRLRIAATGQHGRAAVASGLTRPTLAFAATGHIARLTGRRYTPDSIVTLTYANRIVGRAHADRVGDFRYELRLPTWTRPEYRLVGTDPVGRQATVSGLVRR